VVGPHREREDRAENVDAGVQVVEVQMDEPLLDDNNIEVVEVWEDDNNVEVMDVLMNGDEQVPLQVEVVPDDDDYVGVFDVSPLYVIEEVSKYISYK